MYFPAQKYILKYVLVYEALNSIYLVTSKCCALKIMKTSLANQLSQKATGENRLAKPLADLWIGLVQH